MTPDRNIDSNATPDSDHWAGLDPSWTPVVYRELRRMANALLTTERDGHTLEPTALAHEVWIRLSKSRNAGSLEHGAFLRVAAQAMRRILTEHARRRSTQKRGGSERRTTLSGQEVSGQEVSGQVISGQIISGQAISPEPQDFALDLDDALDALKAYDPELVEVVLLRFYAGCEVEEVATALAISPRTVKRRWRFARAWLQQYMEDKTT